MSSSETGPTPPCFVWFRIDCTRFYNASCACHSNPGPRLGSAFGRTISRNAEALCRRGCFHIYYLFMYFYLRTSYSAGRSSVTYSFGSLKTKRVIPFYRKVHQSQSLTLHNALCSVPHVGFCLFPLGRIVFASSNGKVCQITRSLVLPEWQI